MDSYQEEAVRIFREKSELDQQLINLIAKVRQEAPERFSHDTDYIFCHDSDKAWNFAHYLEGHDFYVKWLNGDTPNLVGGYK